MSLDEITRALQSVAENQQQTKQRQAELEATVQEIAQFHQQVLRNHEARQTHLDEAFKQVAVSHQMVVELLRIQEERIDGHNDATMETDARLNVLIDSQIRLGEKVDKLTADITAVNGRADRTDARLDRIGEYIEAHSRHLSQIDAQLDKVSASLDQVSERLDQVTARLDQVAGLQAENAEQIRALVAAQASAGAKPKARSAKKVNKSAKKRGGAK